MTENIDQSLRNPNQAVHTKLKGRVAFKEVSCRLYERTVGLHPAVTRGPALEFGWNFSSTKEVPLDEYEDQLKNKIKRNEADLKLSKFEREKILRAECGLSNLEIASYVRKTNKARDQRHITIMNLKYAGIEEKWENFRNCISEALFLRKKVDKEVSILLQQSNIVDNLSLESKSLSDTQTTHSSGSSLKFRPCRDKSHEYNASSLSLLCCHKGKKQEYQKKLSDNERQTSSYSFCRKQVNDIVQMTHEKGEKGRSIILYDLSGEGPVMITNLSKLKDRKVTVNLDDLSDPEKMK